MKATAAAVMTPVAVQPSAVSQGPLTSLPMMRGLPPTSITRRSNGGARSPLTTAEKKRTRTGLCSNQVQDNAAENGAGDDDEEAPRPPGLEREPRAPAEHLGHREGGGAGEHGNGKKPRAHQAEWGEQ